MSRRIQYDHHGTECSQEYWSPFAHEHPPIAFGCRGLSDVPYDHAEEDKVGSPSEMMRCLAVLRRGCVGTCSAESHQQQRPTSASQDARDGEQHRTREHAPRFSGTDRLIFLCIRRRRISVSRGTLPFRHQWRGLVVHVGVPIAEFWSDADQCQRDASGSSSRNRASESCSSRKFGSGCINKKQRKRFSS